MECNNTFSEKSVSRYNGRKKEGCTAISMYNASISFFIL